MKKKYMVAAAVVIALATAGVSYLIRARSIPDPGTIRVSGNVEITDAQVSFKIAGRVVARELSEGNTVVVGQVVARLDSEELAQELSLRGAEVAASAAALAELEAGSRPEEISQAEAAAGQARARLEELLAGSRQQEVGAAEASVRRAQAELERSQAEFERQRRLFAADVISGREYEAAQTAHATARARLQENEEHLKLVREGPRKEQIEQARASLVQAQERLKLIRKGPRRETIEQARARLQQTREALALAQTRLDYATVVSPLAGLVLSENVEPGEYVLPGTPIVTVGWLDKVWVRAYIDETDLGRVKVGQPVKVTADSYPGKSYDGRISFVASAAEFTPKNVQTQKERVKLVYRIKIDIDNPNMELKPGMPADADILLSKNP